MFAQRNRTIRCPHCGGEARFSDKARFAEAVGGQFLAVVIFGAVFLLPWWGAFLIIIGLMVTFVALVNLVFPLVPAERFGSAPDIRRAGIRFWLVAPIALVVLIALLVMAVRG